MVDRDEQRMKALDRANEVRTGRAELKKRLKAKEVTPLDVLADPPAIIEGMKLRALLESVPKVGKIKADGILRKTHTSHLTVGRLSPVTRDEILRRLP